MTGSFCFFCYEYPKKSLSEKSSLSRSSVRAEREKDRDGDKERPRRVVKGAIREGLAHASTEDADMQVNTLT